MRLDDAKIATILESALEATENEIATTEAPARKQTPQGTEPDRTRLLTDILTKYNKRVNPDDVKLDFGVNLIDFRVVSLIRSEEMYSGPRIVAAFGSAKYKNVLLAVVNFMFKNYFFSGKTGTQLKATFGSDT